LGPARKVIETGYDDFSLTHRAVTIGLMPGNQDKTSRFSTFLT